MTEKLLTLGLSKEILEECDNIEDKYLGRVIAEYKNMYKVSTEMDDILAKVTGKFIENIKGIEDYPAVGDWVLVDRNSDRAGIGIISKVLHRKSVVSRKVAGKRLDEQVIAANIDYLFICMSVNRDFNIRRLERYITIGWNSGAIPVVVLTKSDLCNDLEAINNEIKDIALGIDILFISSYTGEGIDKLNKYLQIGKTIAFIGSSGVGKSTLINYLIGDNRMNVNSIREDDHKGKHTTTHRELIVIEGKGIVIDTPGMREIQLLDDIEGVDNSFIDIINISKNCKFRNCKHNTEPGCAVQNAIDSGEISKDRLTSYNKLLKEAKFLERKNKKTIRS